MGFGHKKRPPVCSTRDPFCWLVVSITPNQAAGPGKKTKKPEKASLE
jgi:hypothetical protein